MTKEIITIDAINQSSSQQKSNKYSTFKISMLTAIVALTTIMCAGKMLKVIETGNKITIHNMMASIDDLMATEDNEKLIYQKNAFRHYAETFSRAKAIKLANADTEAYFEARRLKRDDDKRLTNNMLDETEKSMENGSSVQRLVNFIMSDEKIESKPLPISAEQGYNYNMQQQANIHVQSFGNFKPSLPRVDDVSKWNKCKKLKPKEQKKHGCPPPMNINF